MKRLALLVFAVAIVGSSAYAGPPVAPVLLGQNQGSWPAGATDTGLNAALPDLGGKTCQQYCNGNFPVYTGGDPTAGQTIECKTIKQQIDIQYPNVTIRCNDINPGLAWYGVNVKLRSGSTIPTNFKIEGNNIHNVFSPTNPSCATYWLNVYDGYGTVTRNHFYYGTNIGLQSQMAPGSPGVDFSWNYVDGSLDASATCPTSHFQDVHVFGIDGLKIHNNNFTQVPGGTGTLVLENRVTQGGGQINNVAINQNFIEGGGYTLWNGGAAGDCPTDVNVTNNTFGTAPGDVHFGYLNYHCGSTFTQKGGSFTGNVCSTNGATMIESDGDPATACTH